MESYKEEKKSLNKEEDNVEEEFQDIRKRKKMARKEVKKIEERGETEEKGDHEELKEELAIHRKTS